MRFSVDSTDFDVDDRVFVVRLSLCVFAFDRSNGRFRCSDDIDNDAGTSDGGRLESGGGTSVAKCRRPSEPVVVVIKRFYPSSLANTLECLYMASLLSHVYYLWVR